MRGDEVEWMQEEAQEFRDAWDGFVRDKADGRNQARAIVARLSFTEINPV